MCLTYLSHKHNVGNHAGYKSDCDYQRDYPDRDVGLKCVDASNKTAGKENNY